MNTPHKNRKYFAGGIDNGFGSYKLLIEDHPLIVIPSYLSEAKMEAVPGRVQIGDKEYTVGESAQRCGLFYSRNVDSAANKLEYALPMLLGAIAHLEPRREWHLSLAASIHDSDNLSQQLIQSLSGEHECVLSGAKTKVTVEVCKVIPEGMGALVGVKIPTKLTVLDFGNGTTLLSHYAHGKREYHEPVHCGVEKLISLIATEMKSLNNGLPGDCHLIRAGLEAGDLSYGRSRSFKSVYKRCLTDWFDNYLRRTITRAKEAYERGDTVWCLGGGCLLPGFNQNLSKAGFIIHETPVSANVLGLQKLAKKLTKVVV